jgi:hypothetical protein
MLASSSSVTVSRNGRRPAGRRVMRLACGRLVWFGMLALDELAVGEGGAGSDPTGSSRLAKAVNRIAQAGRRTRAAGGAIRTRVRGRSRSAGRRAELVKPSARSTRTLLVLRVSVVRRGRRVGRQPDDPRPLLCCGCLVVCSPGRRLCSRNHRSRLTDWNLEIPAFAGMTGTRPRRLPCHQAATIA